jgi:uncharacterized protein (DUF169 family)
MTAYEEYSTKLKPMLGLPVSPVAISYTDDAAEDAVEGQHWACYGLITASQGATVDLTPATCRCPGGILHLGLGPPLTGEGWKRLRDFLVSGEKLCASYGALLRMQHDTTPPPTGLADHVIYQPLEKCKVDPELVLFIVNPKQACRLVTLLTFHDGKSLRPELGGSTCHQVIGYPLVSGEPTVALGDWTNRHPERFTENDLFVTVPWHRMHNMMAAIPYCTAGEAELEMPPEFEELIREMNE